ncbi:MAG TPA: TadE/TadG family type IV pilus assembly protein [Rhizomicrobium sp.]|jgi:hypothetical protein|nr:TadE/TadG family type IV pilus assembly protein [Rhizomicrobium sp.]
MIAKFLRDRRGVTALVTAFGFVVMAGFAGVAVDVASWLAAQRNVQNAADQAAYSAVIGVTGGQSGYVNALAVLAQSGFACSSAGAPNSHGSLTCNAPGGVTAAVNSPPTQGSYTQDSTAWEVIVTQPQQSRFAQFVLASAPSVSARAVGLQGGNVCILALDTRTGDIHSIFGGTSANVTVGGNCQVADNLLNNSDTDSIDVKTGATLSINSLYLRDATKCDSGTCDGTLNVTNAIKYNQRAIVDPYAARTIPAATGSCDHTNLVVTTTQALSPGNYCGTNGNAALTITVATAALTTSTSPGPSGTTILAFPSTSGVSVGMTASDTTHTSGIPAGTTVSAVTSTTVTLSTTVYGGATGVNKNDVIKFASAGGTTVTLSSGVYILDGQGGGTCTGSTKPTTCLSGNLIISNGATVTGTSVTIVLTTSAGSGIDIGNVNITGSSALSISAPTTSVSGYPVQGIALWQDPRAPNPTVTDGNQYTSTTTGVNTISSGASTDITGLVYFPSQGLFYSGGSGGSVCTQIVAFSIVYKASSQFNYPSNCSGAAGELPIGGTASLAE